MVAHAVFDTTLRGRRDDWIAAGVFDALAAEALAAYDVIGKQHSDQSPPDRFT